MKNIIHWLIFVTLLATSQSQNEEDFENQWNFPRDFIENPDQQQNSEEIPYEKSINFALNEDSNNEADARDITSYQNMTSQSSTNEEDDSPIDNTNKEVRFSNVTSAGEAPIAESDSQTLKQDYPSNTEDEKEIQYYSQLYGGEKFLPGDIPHQAKEELHVDNSQPTELQFEQVQQEEGGDLQAKNNLDGGAALESKDNLSGNQETPQQQEQAATSEQNDHDDGDLLEKQPDGDRFINRDSNINNNNNNGGEIKSLDNGEIAKSEQEIVSSSTKLSTVNASVRGNIAKVKKHQSKAKNQKSKNEKKKTSNTQQQQQQQLSFGKPQNTPQNAKSNPVKATVTQQKHGNAKYNPLNNLIYSKQQTQQPKQQQQQVYNTYNRAPFYYNAYYPTATALQGRDAPQQRPAVNFASSTINRGPVKNWKPTHSPLQSPKSILRKTTDYKFASYVQKVADANTISMNFGKQQQTLINHNANSAAAAAKPLKVPNKVATLPSTPLVNNIHQLAATDVQKIKVASKKGRITTSKKSSKYDKKTSKHNTYAVASKRKLKDCRTYRECLELSFAKYGFRITSSVNSVEKLRDFFQIIFKRNYEKILKKEMGRFLKKLSNLRLNNWATIFDYRPRVADWLNVEFLRMPLGDEVPYNMKENVLFNRIVLLKGKIDDLTEDIRSKTVPNKGKSLERKRSYYERSLNNLRSNHTILAQYRKEAPSIAVSGFDRNSQAWAECAPKGWDSNKAPFSKVYQRMMDMNSYQCVLYAFMKCIKDSKKESQVGSFDRNKDGFASLIQLHYDYGARQNRLIPITDKNKYEYERITSAYCESADKMRCLQEDGVTREESFKFEGKHYCQNYFGCLATCGEKCFLKERNLLPDEFDRLKDWLRSSHGKKHDKAESELWTECCINQQDCIPLQEAKGIKPKKDA